MPREGGRKSGPGSQETCLAMSSCVRPGCAGCMRDDRLRRRVGVVAAGNSMRLGQTVSPADPGSWNLNREAVMRSNRILLSFILLGCLTPVAQADDIGEAVVITATRTPQPVEKTGESISVITADDLKIQQIVSLANVLQQTPGLIAVRNGGLGQNATVSVRGAEAGQTLV